MKIIDLPLLPVVLAALLGGCAGSRDAAPPSPPDEPAVAEAAPLAGAAALNAERAWQWSHSCALCHVTGNGGAPRVGNAQEWMPRLAQGRSALLEHAIEGFNNMPPLGYCMSCERDDLIAMIEFMLPPSAPEDAR